MSTKFRATEIEVLPGSRVDSKNAALYLGFSTKTLAQWRSMKKGPAYLRAGRIFYRVEDLEQWLAARRVRSTAEAAVLDRREAPAADQWR